CERCMAAFNMEWDSLRLLGPTDWDNTGGKLFLAEAKEIVATSLNTAKDGRWGCKNPRMARTLWMWMEAFRRADCQDFYVICLRNPLSVAASVIAGSPHRAVGNNPTHIYLMWLMHMVGSLQAVMADKPAVLVDYDLVMAQPTEQLMRIAAGLALPISAEGQASIEAYGRDFLRPGLRHAVFTPKDLENSPLVPPVVSRAYGLLANIAADRTSLTSKEFHTSWQQITREVAERSVLFAYIDSLYGKLMGRHRLAKAVYRRLPLKIKRLLVAAGVGH
ncbi:MAG: hypothetical protein M0Z50_01390, partial [Planctomycetia bacterium]|nr:hypothetical protein [Planctomycetia bacterium]